MRVSIAWNTSIQTREIALTNIAVAKRNERRCKSSSPHHFFYRESRVSEVARAGQKANRSASGRSPCQSKT
jgi:hypothetical protein